MSYPAKTIFAFGLYLLGLGAVLVLVPNLLAAQKNWEGFIALTIPLRLSVIVFFAAFVFFVNAPMALLLFGATDLAFALWTWNATRQSGASSVRSVALTTGPYAARQPGTSDG